MDYAIHESYGLRNLYESYGLRNPYELTHMDYVIYKCFFFQKYIFLIYL